MQTVERMMTTSPVRHGAPSSVADCIAACIECAQACVACADACLAEPSVQQLRRCIRTNQDCADICGATGRVLSRLFESDLGVQRAQLEACALICATCAAECDRHGQHHEHCKVCADACRRCEEECRRLLGATGVVGKA